MDNQSFYWTDCIDMIRLPIDVRVIKKKKKQELVIKKTTISGKA